MEKEFQGTKIELTQGNIASQNDITVVVNAANAQLKIGGGVAGAIHRAAGPELEKACRPLAPIQPGEAVITKGFNLPNDYVIHTLGPVYGRDKPEAELLSKCYKNSLEIAEEEGIDSIAFPAISTGAFGYPVEEAAAIAINTVVEEISDLDSLKIIRFVLFSKKDYRIHQQVLENY